MPDDGLTFGAVPLQTADDGLDFGGHPQPPNVPPDPTGEDWRGPPGEDGVDGQNGSHGRPMLSGSGPPTGSQPVGTSYLDATTGDVWHYV